MAERCRTLLLGAGAKAAAEAARERTIAVVFMIE